MLDKTFVAKVHKVRSEKWFGNGVRLFYFIELLLQNGSINVELEGRWEYDEITHDGRVVSFTLRFAIWCSM